MDEEFSERDQRVLFEILLHQIWLIGLTGRERVHITLQDSPTAPNGIPVVMERYERIGADGKKFWIVAGRSVDDVYLRVDRTGKIVHPIEVEEGV